MIASLLTGISPLALLIIGAPLNSLAALISFWRKSVDEGGAAAGAVLGTVVFVAAGPLLWPVLAAFVLSSSAFTRFRASEKEWLSAIQEKGGRRDALQVVANGGVGMLMALLLRATRDPAWALGFAAAFASANADTWASEIGVLSRRQPVSLPTFRSVPRGVSGGVTLLGLLSSVGGALLVALLFGLANLSVAPGLSGLGLIVCVTAGTGVLGSLIDSILGSTAQAQYAASTRTPTERRITGGAENTLIRGLSFITNDVVNLVSTAAAAAAAVLFSLLLR